MSSAMPGWTQEEKEKLVQIDAEERVRGSGFMNRIKQRWEAEYPSSTHTTKNLINNARRFKLECNIAPRTEAEEARNKIKTSATWTTNMKVRLLQLEKQARQGGRGFMQRLKQIWDIEFTEFRHLDGQCLRDNASRFKRDKTITNLLLVQQGATAIEKETESTSTLETYDELEAEQIPSSPERDVEVSKEMELTTEEDEPLKTRFMKELGELDKMDVKTIDEREKLGKTYVSNKLKNSANRILHEHLAQTNEIGIITDAVYAMARAIRQTLKCQQSGKSKKTENRMMKKLRRQLKESRQRVAMISNEIHRRKGHRKITEKETENLRFLKIQARSKLQTHASLTSTKEKWLDQMRSRKVRLNKMVQKDTRVRNNAMFERNEGKFYQCAKGETERTGNIPKMNKFTEFWGGIWEDDQKTTETEWMKDIGNRIKEKIQEVHEFMVCDKDIKEVIKKKKNWTAPGIDGIENFWWKIFTSTWQPLSEAMNSWIEDQSKIPEWLAIGRTVLIPKAIDLSSEKDYRPITCLNTSYKIFTGVLGKYMKQHAVLNNVWDRNQMGTCSDVLGTVDQLLIDNCILEEVREHKRNLAVAYYDYQKAYDKVHHDWMLKVYNWMGYPQKVIDVIATLMGKWWTRLEVNRNGIKERSRWIEIKRGFLQGDSFSPVGFCLTEVPVAMLLNDTEGYRMGPPGKREIKRTHSLFIDDLKVYQPSHEKLKAVNKMIVRASLDTGACYGVKKCAEIVFNRGKMVKGEGLEVLNERMKTLDPEQNECYKFLGCEQAEGIDTDIVFGRVKDEMEKRMKTLIDKELHERNLVKAINTRVIPVASYVMNVCNFTKKQLDSLDKAIKHELREANMHGKQASDERLYLSKEKGGRGLKSIKDVYEDTKIRVACYMAYQDSQWIKSAWEKETAKEGKSLSKDVTDTLSVYGIEAKFDEDGAHIEGQRMIGTWKEIWKDLKSQVRRRREVNRKYMNKSMQSEFYKELDEGGHEWLKCNINPKKVGAIINMQEQMVETRAWKKNRGIDIQTDKCRLCGKCSEGVLHLASGCQLLAGTDYLNRHNNVLKVLMTAWAIENKLLEEDQCWYKQKWEKGMVMENDAVKMAWDFEYHMRKETTARRPDVTIEYKEQKLIQVIDMACPSDKNISDKVQEKLQKYQQLAYEIRERRPGYHVEIIPVVIGCMGGGATQLKEQIRRIMNGTERTLVQTWREMLKTVLAETEGMIRKVLSNITTAN